MHNPACNICQPISPSLMFESEFFMINTHQVHDGCMKIMYMYRRFAGKAGFEPAIPFTRPSK